MGINSVTSAATAEQAQRRRRPITEQVMDCIDKFVRAADKQPYQGWNDEQDLSKGYYPVIQQERAEFQEFVSHILNIGLGATAIQIGLGISGGSHFALRQIFERVITIDCDQRNLDRFMGFYNPEPGADFLVHGNSTNPYTIKLVQSIEPAADLLFIDGDHEFDGVRADWVNYHTLVRPGGMVCFHNSIDRPIDHLEVHQFLNWLRPQLGKEIIEIGTQLGIAYYIV